MHKNPICNHLQHLLHCGTSAKKQPTTTVYIGLTSFVEEQKERESEKQQQDCFFSEGEIHNENELIELFGHR